jgi:hypothetical protein
MTSVQITSLEVVGFTALGGLTAHLLNLLPVTQGVAIGAINGLTVAIVDSNCKNNRPLYSIGALSLFILGAHILAPKLKEQITLPPTQALIALAIPPAVYVLGKGGINHFFSKKSLDEEKKPLVTNTKK